MNIFEKEMNLVIDRFGDLYSLKRSKVSSDELAFLKVSNLPDIIIDFYERYAVKENLYGLVDFLPISTVEWEVAEYPRGKDVYGYGYVPCFASDGNLYLFDTNVITENGPRIVYLSHEWKFDPSSHEAIKKSMCYVAKDLKEFLTMFIEDDIPFDDGDFEEEDLGI